MWNMDRIESIREAIREGRALPAIQVSLHKDGLYHISDGIHRYNASLEAGFTHVPAIVSVMVDTPEMKVGPMDLVPTSNVAHEYSEERYNKKHGLARETCLLLSGATEKVAEGKAKAQ